MVHLDTQSTTLASMPTMPMPQNVRSVAVVGGGTAGYFVALALRRQLPHLEVTLIESSKIPIIGVGEATTTLMPPFLHRQLGIDIVELYREVRPTWKLGIKFEWGLPGDYHFNYPFGHSSPVDAYAYHGNLANLSVGGMMMAADRAPVVIDDHGDPVSLLPRMNFAYHLDNKSLVAYLARLGERVGLHHIDAEIRDVVTADGESVERLILDDGREIHADLYVDASGFRALLIERALGSQFKSFATSLFCDSAVIGEVPQRGPIQPYTTAETMDAGWCWRIPVEGEDHRGYVYSSAHLTPDEARAEMQARNPGLGDTWSVRFRSGRHEDFWKGNTVAVGNAYGFVEPLESTALHMVIIEIAYLIGALRQTGGNPLDRALINQCVGGHWDCLRWFLSVHYKYNHKKDTEFWRACRETVDVSGIEPLLDRFRRSGPWDEDEVSLHETVDPTFGNHGLMIMLLGQSVACPQPIRTALSRAEWDARVAEDAALVGRALDQAQALALLRRRPELLQEIVAFKGSWIVMSEVGPSGEWRRLQQLVSRTTGGATAAA